MAAAPQMMRSAKMAAEGMAQSAPMAMNASLALAEGAWMIPRLITVRLLISLNLEKNKR